jgi:heterogeneous nuclear ribonucleoprotein F/H
MGMGMGRRGNMRQQGMSGQGRMGGDRMGMMKGGSQPGCHYISKTGHSVHMRGLPFQANDQDVADVSLLKSFLVWNLVIICLL